MLNTTMETVFCHLPALKHKHIVRFFTDYRDRGDYSHQKCQQRIKQIGRSNDY